MNTETPIEMSFANSVTRQSVPPHGHDSNVYTIDVNGTQISITSKSASASESIYLEISKVN